MPRHHIPPPLRLWVVRSDEQDAAASLVSLYGKCSRACTAATCRGCPTGRSDYGDAAGKHEHRKGRLPTSKPTLAITALRGREIKAVFYHPRPFFSTLYWRSRRSCQWGLDWAAAAAWQVLSPGSAWGDAARPENHVGYSNAGGRYVEFIKRQLNMMRIDMQILVRILCLFPGEGKSNNKTRMSSLSLTIKSVFIFDFKHLTSVYYHAFHCTQCKNSHNSIWDTVRDVI